MNMDSSNFVAEKDFLFLIEVKNEAYYRDHAELAAFLSKLPDGVRIYTIIHAGMNTLKIYCITRSYRDYGIVSEMSGGRTDIIEFRKFSEERHPGLN